MKKLTTFGKVRDEQLYIYKIQEFYESLGMFGDCDIVLTAEKSYGKRSNQQNRYYWGVLIPAFCVAAKDTTGDDWMRETAHDTLKGRFLKGEYVNEDTGEILMIIRSTTQLTTTEFSEYIEKCRAFVSEWFGAYVPDPNEDEEEWRKITT